MKRHLAILAVVCGLIANNAQAEILTIDGTIKAVDVEGRIVTVTRASETKSKDLVLEVGKKARISVDGKDASLDALKAGQAASVSYETALELITKIEISTAGTSASMTEGEKDALKTTGCRVIWTIAEDAESIVTIGRPLESRNPASNNLIRHEDGTVELQYDFETSESVQRAMRVTSERADNVGFNQSQKALVLTHKKGQPHGTANFAFSKYVQFPVTIEYEFDGLKEGKGFLVGVNLRPRENVKFPVLNVEGGEGFKSSATIRPLWVESRDSKGSASVQQKMEPQTIDLDATNEFTFSLPVTDQDQQYLPELGVIGEDVPVALRYLSIRGRLLPTFGVALDDRNGTVMAKKVFPGSLGESIGMKSGDIIEKINDMKPGTMKNALELLGKIQIGDEAEIIVKRGSRTVKIEFTAE